MSQQTAAARPTSIEPPESTSRSRRRSLLFAVFLLMVVCGALGYLNGVAEGRLVDTDAYSWLNRVTDLRSDVNWFDDTIQRINPNGLKQHWSRPFDVILMLGGLIGTPFVGFTDALLAWAIVLPCLLGVGTLWVLWWGFSDLLDDAGIEALALLATLQVAIVQGFMAGRSDHQALLALLLITQLALARKAFGARGTRRQLIVTGAVSALGLWVGMELIIFVVAIMIAVAVEWLLTGNASIRRLTLYALALALFSLVWLVVENGSHGFVQTELDELSIVFVAFALLASAACGVLTRASGRMTTPKARALALVVVAGVCGAVLIGAFPELLGGPLGGVDPLYERTRLRNIAEIQPLLGNSVAESVQKAVPSLSLLPLALYACAFLLRSGTVINQQLHLLFVPAVLYLPLAVRQVRWLLPLCLLLMIPAALAAQRLMRFAAPRAKRVHLGMMAVAAGAALWWFPFLFVPVPDRPTRCDINAAVATLNNERSVGADGGRLMAFVDYGPELLFRTRYGVFAIPNHRHQPGYTATYEAMTVHDVSEARQILQRNAVDLVLVCSDAVETAFYGRSKDSFHARLVAGDSPVWLTELRVEGSDPGFRLYRLDDQRADGSYVP